MPGEPWRHATGRRQPNEALRTHLRVLEIREGLGPPAARQHPIFLRIEPGAGSTSRSAFAHLNRLPEAVAMLEHAWREFEEIHRERPNDAYFTIWLVDFLNPLADALRASGNTVRMLSASSQACGLAEELARAHPETPDTRSHWPTICATILLV